MDLAFCGGVDCVRLIRLPLIYANRIIIDCAVREYTYAAAVTETDGAVASEHRVCLCCTPNLTREHRPW